MKRWSIIGVIVVVVGIVITATFLKTSTQAPSVTDNKNTKIKVAATFYPLAEFARQIGKDKIEVLMLVPSGSEPHSFEPKPQDIIRMQESQVIIYNGANFEPWFEKTKPELEKSNIKLVQATENLQLIQGEDDHSQEEEIHEEKGVQYDPHVWLDPILSIQIVDKITASLKEIDPQNADIYQENATAFKQQLTTLDLNYKSSLQSCKKRQIITSHNAFAYLASRYNFTAIPISGISPDEEPTPQKLGEIVQIARQNQIKYIFFESLVSPRISDTIATEVGAKTLVFNPIEGLTDEQIQQGENYISIHNQNLQNLKTALECS